jgi:hypothetical protein
MENTNTQKSDMIIYQLITEGEKKNLKFYVTEKSKEKTSLQLFASLKHSVNIKNKDDLRLF